MKKIRTKIISVLLVILIVMPMFTGCSSGLKVIFAYLDDSKKVEEIKVSAGGQVSKPDMAAIAKDGYEFKGWFAEGSEDEAKFPYTVNDTTIFVAKWNVIQYTIKYVSDIGEAPSDSTYTVDKRIKLTTPKPVLGKVFEDWYTNEDFSGQAVKFINKNSMTGNKTFYAKWRSTEIFTAAFVSEHLDNGIKTVDFSISVMDSIVFPDLSDKAQQYYMFAGWSESGEAGGTIITSLSEERNYTLYAQFRPIEYKIEYELNGGIWNFTPTTKFTVIDGLTLNEIPYREAKNFVAWYDNPELSGDPVTALGLGTGYTGNVKLYAKWKDLSVGQSSIDYRLNGGSLTASAPLFYDHGTETVLPIPTRSGYIFAGWTRTNDPLAEKITKILASDSGIQVFYAQWNAEVYTIQYETNGGTLSENYKVSYTVETIPAIGLGLPAATGVNGIIKLNGYDFKGWYREADFSGTVYTNIPRGTTGNFKFYAKWTPTEYKYVYQFGDGRAAQFMTYNIETPTFDLIRPERTNYTFKGWYGNADFTGSVITSIEKGTTGEIQLYAKWEGLPFEVNYNLNGGGSLPGGTPSTQTIRVGDSPFMPVPARSGFIFGGWYTSQADANSASNNSRQALNRIAKDYYSAAPTTYYAKWITGTVSSNTQTFEAEYTDLNGGLYNSMVNGTGLSGSAAGEEMINGWSSASNKGAVGWLHGNDITLLFAIYSDRYVENATLSVALGCEFIGSRTSFNSQSLKFAVNGNTVNYTNSLNISLKATSDVPPPFTTTALNTGITLLPGLNFITITTTNVSITDYGPEIDFIRIQSTSNLAWDPATTNKWPPIL